MSADESTNNTKKLAEVVAYARAGLEADMNALGLKHSEGWSILEKVVNSPDGGTVWLLLPVHAEEPPPDGLVVRIAIDSDGKIRG